MTRNRCLCTIACAVLAIGGRISHAQARDAWLMQNYRFTGPPRPVAAAPVDPVVTDLREIQNTLMSIMRKTDFYGDYEGAFIAAGQAAANAQQLAAITHQLEAAAAAREGLATVPVYAIALKDHTVISAIAYWIDGPTLHFVTPAGIHMPVRLDLVDRQESIRLNRARNLEFHLPE
jgi:hypothetical protein